jgi:hypothetical protein
VDVRPIAGALGTEICGVDLKDRDDSICGSSGA